MKVENIGLLPTFETIREGKVLTSNIDVTLSKRLTSDELNGWEVNREFNGSDHNTIEFNLELGTKPGIATRNWNSCDWKVFEQQMGKEKWYDYDEVNKKKLDKMVDRL